MLTICYSVDNYRKIPAADTPVVDAGTRCCVAGKTKEEAVANLIDRLGRDCLLQAVVETEVTPPERLVEFYRLNIHSVEEETAAGEVKKHANISIWDYSRFKALMENRKNDHAYLDSFDRSRGSS